jgi:hypothetical protein
MERRFVTPLSSLFAPVTRVACVLALMVVAFTVEGLLPAASVCAALCISLAALVGVRAALKQLLWFLPLVVLVAVLSPLVAVVTAGRVSAAALELAVAQALVLLACLLAFAVAARVVEPADLAFAGRTHPKLSLALTQTVTMLAQVGERFARTRQVLAATTACGPTRRGSIASKTAGGAQCNSYGAAEGEVPGEVPEEVPEEITASAPASQENAQAGEWRTRVRLAKDASPLVVSTAALTLDGALTQGEVLEVRGIALAPRTALPRARARATSRDAVVLAVVVLLALAALVASWVLPVLLLMPIMRASEAVTAHAATMAWLVAAMSLGARLLICLLPAGLVCFQRRW